MMVVRPDPEGSMKEEKMEIAALQKKISSIEAEMEKVGTCDPQWEILLQMRNEDATHLVDLCDEVVSDDQEKGDAGSVQYYSAIASGARKAMRGEQ